MNQQITHTIKDLPADVEQGIMIGFDGTIGDLGGVTLSGADAGASVVVCLLGVCEIQVEDATVAEGDEIEINASGRAIPLAAGTKVGEALQDGVAAVGGVYAHKEIFLNR